MIRRKMYLLLPLLLLQACFPLDIVLNNIPGREIPFQLYPVKGPMSMRDPLPITSVKPDGNLISFALPGGEVFKGHWSIVKIGSVSQTASGGVVTPEMSSSRMWDCVFGSGYFVANVLGSKNHCQAILIGDRGTTLCMESNQSESYSNGNTIYSPKVGVAEDSSGNVFKIIY